MPGVSETDLVNAALRLVGGTRITSLTQGVKNANVGQDLYEIVRDDLLRCHNWNFATKRQELARSSTAPGFEFDHAYVVPSDWMRTVSVHDNDAGIGTIVYREENVANQRCLLAGAERLFLRYVAQVTDPNMMAADFRKALVTSLARDIALPISNSNSLREFYERKADRDILRAKGSDALGASPERRPVGSWVASRGGWR